MRKSASALMASALVLAGAACSPSAVPSPSPFIPTKPVVTSPSSSGATLLINLRMVNATTGWAMAFDSVGAGLVTLVRTTDGGAHWPRVPLPPALEGIIDATDFHDDRNAWLLIAPQGYSTASHEGVVVVNSADGGLRWLATPMFNIDGRGTGIEFVDPLHGWVFATPSAGGAIGAGDTTLYRTVDGGVHWQAIKPPSEVLGNPRALGGLPEPCPMGGGIGRPTFVNALTGWLGAFCDRPFFYVSRDGGLSWKPQNLPPFPGSPASQAGAGLQYNVDSFEAMSPSDYSVVVHRGMTTGANALQEAALYLSRDAGSSWTGIRLPYAELGADFIDPQDGWMIAAGPGGDTEHRSLYATTDGGHTWQLADGPQSFLRQDLNFIDRSTGFVADPSPADPSSLLLRTRDGGRTWTRLKTSVD